MKREWLSITEATTLVPVNRLRLFRDIKRGKLRARRFGWVYLIHIKDLKQYKKIVSV